MSLLAELLGALHALLGTGFLVRRSRRALVCGLGLRRLLLHPGADFERHDAGTLEPPEEHGAADARGITIEEQIEVAPDLLHHLALHLDLRVVLDVAVDHDPDRTIQVDDLVVEEERDPLDAHRLDLDRVGLLLRIHDLDLEVTLGRFPVGAFEVDPVGQDLVEALHDPVELGGLDTLALVHPLVEGRTAHARGHVGVSRFLELLGELGVVDDVDGDGGEVLHVLLHLVGVEAPLLAVGTEHDPGEEDGLGSRGREGLFRAVEDHAIEVDVVVLPELGVGLLEGLRADHALLVHVVAGRRHGAEADPRLVEVLPLLLRVAPLEEGLRRVLLPRVVPLVVHRQHHRIGRDARVVLLELLLLGVLLRNREPDRELLGLDPVQRPTEALVLRNPLTRAPLAVGHRRVEGAPLVDQPAQGVEVLHPVAAFAGLLDEGIQQGDAATPLLFVQVEVLPRRVDQRLADLRVLLDLGQDRLAAGLLLRLCLRLCLGLCLGLCLRLRIGVRPRSRRRLVPVLLRPGGLGSAGEEGRGCPKRAREEQAGQGQAEKNAAQAKRLGAEGRSHRGLPDVGRAFYGLEGNPDTAERGPAGGLSGGPYRRSGCRVVRHVRPIRKT